MSSDNEHSATEEAMSLERYEYVPLHDVPPGWRFLTDQGVLCESLGSHPVPVRDDDPHKMHHNEIDHWDKHWRELTGDRAGSLVTTRLDGTRKWMVWAVVPATSGAEKRGEG